MITDYIWAILITLCPMSWKTRTLGMEERSYKCNGEMLKSKFCILMFELEVSLRAHELLCVCAHIWITPSYSQASVTEMD